MCVCKALVKLKWTVNILKKALLPSPAQHTLSYIVRGKTGRRVCKKKKTNKPPQRCLRKLMFFKYLPCYQNHSQADCWLLRWLLSWQSERDAKFVFRPSQCDFSIILLSFTRISNAFQFFKKEEWLFLQRHCNNDAIYSTESKIKTYVIVLPWSINTPELKCSDKSSVLKLQISLTACEIFCERDVTSSMSN